MPAATMFSKFKSATTSAPPQNPYDNNPITQYFEIGKQVACAGPELIWKIHEGYRKTDGKVSVCLCVCTRRWNVLHFQSYYHFCSSFLTLWCWNQFTERIYLI